MALNFFCYLANFAIFSVERLFPVVDILVHSGYIRYQKLSEIAPSSQQT